MGILNLMIFMFDPLPLNLKILNWADLCADTNFSRLYAFMYTYYIDVESSAIRMLIEESLFWGHWGIFKICGFLKDS